MCPSCTLLAYPTLSDSSDRRQALLQPCYCSHIQIGIELGNRLQRINSVDFYKEGGDIPNVMWRAANSGMQLLNHWRRLAIRHSRLGTIHRWV